MTGTCSRPPSRRGRGGIVALSRSIGAWSAISTPWPTGSWARTLGLAGRGPRAPRVVGNLAFLWMRWSVSGPKRPVEAWHRAAFSVYPGTAYSPTPASTSPICWPTPRPCCHSAWCWSAIASIATTARSRLAISRAPGTALPGESSSLPWAWRWRGRGLLVRRLGPGQEDALARARLEGSGPISCTSCLAPGFLIWRLFIFSRARGAQRIWMFLLGPVSSLPLRSALSVGVETIKDIFETTVLAWSVPFYQFVRQAATIGISPSGAGRRWWFLHSSISRRRELCRTRSGTRRDLHVPIHMLTLGAAVAVFALLD